MRNDYNGLFNVDDMKGFIDRNITPWVSPLNDLATNYIFGKSNNGMIIYRRDYEGPKYKKILDKLAPDYHYDMIFTYADLGQQENKRIGDHLGVSASMMPFAIIVDNSNNEFKKFIYKDEITDNGLKKFIK